MSKTYFVTDRQMLKHYCEWDETHIEVPERLERIIDKLEGSSILEQCSVLKAKMASEEDILLVHTPEYFDTIKKTQEQTMEDNELLSSHYEDIYINNHTFPCAMLAAGSSIKMMQKVLDNPGSNGFAAIRPPGHHAGPNEGCGFCIFNNVAICAVKALDMGLDRVLIIDFDVHAGQGTQYCIEDHPGILLVSIHRYESGQYWPNLPESGVDTM
uniref:Histone deacetylase domain-containing protein n=1 Tax=Panagrolaimus sp. JU765 TaxID=591449 RepID=A0AC34QP98_9BILA